MTSRTSGSGLRRVRPLDAPGVIAEILAGNRVTSFRVFEAHELPLVQERLSLTRPERRLVNSAMRIRRSLALPFHDALLLSMNARTPQPRLIRAVGEHHSYPLREYNLHPGESAMPVLSRLLADRRADTMLVVSSEITVATGRTLHVPMLDFRFPPSPRQQLLVEAVLRELNAPRGYLLVSGGSYHYYGERLMSPAELQVLLAHAVLYSPLLDKIWIAHQWIEGRCGLRFSVKPSGAGIPRVVKRL